MTLYDPQALVRHITQEIGRLTAHLASAEPAEAAQVLAQVLAPEGILDEVTDLMAAGSRFARDCATVGALPAEVWLAIGRAANELAAVSNDLAEHTEDLHRLARPPVVVGIPPVASPLVARRHR
ncbi:hypothetical protein ACIBEA_14720 [Streptomyces sp. NPDC051555]|uniref:hypothetical protein n=1 Tax=Streptomyces sp. NPDC051555 TaxID=3365657 RepID=UPI0037968897